MLGVGKEPLFISTGQACRGRKNPTVSLVSITKAKSTREIAAVLGFEPNARIFSFVNRLAMHGETVMIESVTMAEERYPGLSEAVLPERPSTFYNFYRMRSTSMWSARKSDCAWPLLVTSQPNCREFRLVRRCSKFGSLPTPVIRPVELRISHMKKARREYVGPSASREEPL